MFNVNFWSRGIINVINLMSTVLTGSSKAMEPNMAISMVERMNDRGCSVGVMHADNEWLHHNSNIEGKI